MSDVTGLDKEEAVVRQRESRQVSDLPANRTPVVARGARSHVGHARRPTHPVRKLRPMSMRNTQSTKNSNQNAAPTAGWLKHMRKGRMIATRPASASCPEPWSTQTYSESDKYTPILYLSRNGRFGCRNGRFGRFGRFHRLRSVSAVFAASVDFHRLRSVSAVSTVVLEVIAWGLRSSPSIDNHTCPM